MTTTQKILYGPPGTGKTWRAARLAVQAVSPGEYDAAMVGADPHGTVAKLHKRLVDEGRIVWVTFHPSYSYEDFIEGYRPILADTGQLIYKVVDGPFKEICDRARAQSDLQIGEQLTDAKGRPSGQVFDKDPGGWIVRVRPDREDEVAAEQYKYVPRWTIRRFMKLGLPPTVFSIPGKSLLDLRDYGINETDADVPPPKAAEKETDRMRVGSTVRRIIGARVQGSSSDLANSSHYAAVYRRLLELQATSQPAPVCMVIDEINRADLSRVFGELLTLLELDKREGMPEARQVRLPYSKSQFSVPANVSIIGTMNTVDRSLTAMDFAMRRRFEFEFVDAEPSRCPSNHGGVDVERVLSVVNRRLSVLLGAEYRLGHAALMESSLQALAQSKGWHAAPDGALRSIAHVWRTYVIPTLLEYFHDDWQKARAVAGAAEAVGQRYELFERMTPDAALKRMLPDEYDLADARSFVHATWWDPQDPGWDADRFKRFMDALAAIG